MDERSSLTPFELWDRWLKAQYDYLDGHTDFSCEPVCLVCGRDCVTVNEELGIFVCNCCDYSWCFD